MLPHVCFRLSGVRSNHLSYRPSCAAITNTLDGLSAVAYLAEMPVDFPHHRFATMPQLDRKHPLTLEWFATDERARGDFLLHEFLRNVMRGINTMRHFRWITERIRACGGEVHDEEPSEEPRSPAQRLPPP